ncbi:MAG TPA: TAT-dependent nitrous-oxide reductase [Verrucomicrobiae bacterium]|nr:TAT-dependent nitrous-oxide reductase [Verrucomicrobiae bacterium]
MKLNSLFAGAGSAAFSKNAAALALIAPLVFAGCNSDTTARREKAGANSALAAQQVYVAPGKLDEYYAFLSGGQSGSIFVYGIPSCRLIKEIPIFEPRAALGYANNPGSETYKRLAATGPFWGDTHHPVASQTDGRYDGHWLWINDKANDRVAKIDLRTFEVAEIKLVPNIQGAHGLAAYLPSGKYIFVNGELETDFASDSADAGKYRSLIAFLDAQTLETKFEISFAGNADIASSGKDGRYVFATMYNTESAVSSEGMIERDRDAIGAIDVPLAEKMLAEGNFTKIKGVPVLDSDKIPGLITRIPVPKNPHGCNVTPDGKYVLASGKLSPTVSIIDAHTLKLLAEPEVGLGPLHTTFDGRGNAYTSLFVDSQIVKWNIEKAIKGDADYIVDRVDVHYNVGHTKAAGSDTSYPSGDWLISLNKLSKGMYLPVGPAMPESQELIDISGEKMRVVAAFPSLPEPHDAVMIHRKVLENYVVQTYEEQPVAVKSGEERIVRNGNKVDVYMTCIRSKFVPEQFEVHEGDEVKVHLTNIETVRDMTHGLAISRMGINVAVDPGQTAEAGFVAGNPGTYWYYCTWFCSALHLEMRGRLLVKPRGAELFDHLGPISNEEKAINAAGEKGSSSYE